MENNNKTPDKTWKEPSTNHSNGTFYAIFHIESKFKNMSQIAGFQKYIEREFYAPNANPDIKNEILIGNKEIFNNAKEYLKDVKIRNSINNPKYSSVIATEVVLSATNGFFNSPKEKVDQWVTLNKEWLQYEFKENCIYATLHKDQFSYHIHGLVIPKFENSKGQSILANKRYFGGKRTIMSEWQEKYYNAVKSLGLQRGIKWSKSKHQDIQKFYNLINADYNELSKEQLIAKAKEAELLKMKNKALNKTLESYKKQLAAEKNKGLVKEVKEEKVKDRTLERVR